jgi:hypothetical protein
MPYLSPIDLLEIANCLDDSAEPRSRFESGASRRARILASEPVDHAKDRRGQVEALMRRAFHGWAEVGRVRLNYCS